MRYTTILKAGLIAVISTAALVQAGDKVDKSIDVKSDGIVEISNVRGIIRVEGWDKNEVSVKGELDDMAENFVFETSRSTTIIKVELPRGRINRGDGSNLIVRVPFGNKVDFSGVSSDFVVSSVKAGIDIRTVSGDVTAEEIESSLKIKTVSGDIDLTDSSGNAKLSSVSGDIEATVDSEEVDVDTVSGDSVLRLTEYKRLKAGTVNGEIWVKGSQADGGRTRMSSVNGDLEITFVGTLNATIKAKAGPGGDITNSLNDVKVEEIFPNQEKLNCEVGNGDGRVTISTVNGSIKVKGD